MLKYHIIADIKKGVYWNCIHKRFINLDEALTFIDHNSEGEYTKQHSNRGLTTLVFKSGKFICNFNPETDDEPVIELLVEEHVKEIVMPKSNGSRIIKSRLISIEELACEALNKNIYLDLARLRKELLKEFPDHRWKTGWKFDVYSQQTECSRVREIVLELENKPRRNRRKIWSKSIRKA